MRSVRRRFRLVGVAGLCAVAFGLVTVVRAARATDPAPPVIGVLVLAHGGAPEWNALVTKAVLDAQLDDPAEITFGMGMHGGEVAEAQRAVDRLVAQGISRLIVVPLLVSSSSEVMRQYEYLFGLRDHGPWEEHAQPLALRVSVTLAQPLDDDPIVAEILTERALALSQSAPEEAVVLVAHGPVSDDENAQWLATMGRVAEQVARLGRFRAVYPVTMRDDAPEPVLQAATESIRLLVETQSAQGRTLVVPHLLARGGVEQKIPKRLAGLTYVYDGQPLLPHPKVSAWLAARVAQVVASGPQTHNPSASPSPQVAQAEPL